MYDYLYILERCVFVLYLLNEVNKNLKNSGYSLHNECYLALIRK